MPVSGRFAMRAAGHDKWDDIEEDRLKTEAPSREQVLTWTAPGLVFLSVSPLAATVPAGWAPVLGASIAVSGTALLDRGFDGPPPGRRQGPRQPMGGAFPSRTSSPPVFGPCPQ